MKLNISELCENIRDLVEDQIAAETGARPWVDVNHSHTHGDAHFFEATCPQKTLSVMISVKEVRGE